MKGKQKGRRDVGMRRDTTRQKQCGILVALLPFYFSVFASVLGPTRALGVPTARPQSAVPAAVRQAYTLLDRGLVNDAIAAFRSFLQGQPQSVAARLGLAVGYQRAGRDAEAWAAYRQVVDRDPNNQPALRAIGLLGSYRPEWQARGIEALTTLLKLKPDDTAARAQRALLLGYQGRFTEAQADYQIALFKRPTPDVVLGAAQTYTYSGDYKQGLELFNRYRTTGKSIPRNAVTAYALALRETGSTARAVQVLKANLQQKQLDETAIEIRAALAEAYEADGQLPEALTVLKPLRESEDAKLALARSLSQIGRREKRADLYARATALYRQVLKQTPDATFALKREIADVLSESPVDQSYALDLYRQLTQLQPNDKSLFVKQLILSNQLGVVSRSELRQRLTQLQPLPIAPTDRRAIALALLQLDPPDSELLPIYQDLLASGVDVPLLNFRVAQIFLQRGQLAEAKQALATYTTTPVGARDAAPELLLGEIERHQGNLEASAGRYQAIIQRQDADKDVVNGALLGLASIRVDQNRLDDAIAIYNRLLARNPQDLRPALARATAAYRAKRITLFQAQAVLDQWLQTQSPNSISPELFGLVSTLPPDPERLDLYEHLLKFEPNNLSIQLRLVQALAVRDPEAARKRVAELLARDPDNIGAYFVRGELAQKIGDLQMASLAYEGILARQPKNADAISALGGVRFQQREYAAAVALYRQVLLLKPQDRDALHALAELSLVQDHPLEALRQLNQLQQTASDSSDNSLNERIQRLRVDLLKRRSFQPSWERY